MTSSSWLLDMVPPMWTKTASSWKSSARASTLRSDIQRHFSLERRSTSCSALVAVAEHLTVPGLRLARPEDAEPATKSHKPRLDTFISLLHHSERCGENVDDVVGPVEPPRDDDAPASWTARSAHQSTRVTPGFLAYSYENGHAHHSLRLGGLGKLRAYAGCTIATMPTTPLQARERHATSRRTR